VATIAAIGEHLPFGNNSFDIVLCDNVVDHAESPRAILEEIERVMVPGGLLYLEVNVHHAAYHSVSLIHTGWRALGVPYEITPFAGHTVHLTINAARGLFSGLPLRILKESDNISEVKRTSRQITIRHAGDWVKRLFLRTLAIR
jgi:ubiquinone/menaquinone biosynthesis C-methylase UbiE